MNIQERDKLRIARLATQTLKSIRQAEKDAWNRKCKSDRPIKLAKSDRTTAPRIVVPQQRSRTSSQPANTNGRDFHTVKVLGLGSRKKGYRYPKAGCRSRAKLITKSSLLENAIPEELADCIIKTQALGIVVKGDEKRKKRAKEILTHFREEMGVEITFSTAWALTKLENLELA
jgi:hypothetical protein